MQWPVIINHLIQGLYSFFRRKIKHHTQIFRHFSEISEIKSLILQNTIL